MKMKNELSWSECYWLLRIIDGKHETSKEAKKKVRKKIVRLKNRTIQGRIKK